MQTKAWLSLPPTHLRSISVGRDGQAGNGSSIEPALSADGRRVAFTSTAGNLLADAEPRRASDINDIFVRDCDANKTVRVTTPPGGGEADGGSHHPSISGDGRFVAFQSAATNLAAGALDGTINVFMRDMQTGQTRCISSRGDNHSITPAVSRNGNYMVFSSAAHNLVAGNTSNAYSIFGCDLKTHAMCRITVSHDGSEPNGDSYQPSISADGRLVAFSSTATNLVPDDTNGVRDIFLRDRQSGTTRRLAADGPAHSPSLSSDGRFVTFVSENGVVVHDVGANSTRHLSRGLPGDLAEITPPIISGDGSYVAFTAVSAATQQRSLYVCDHEADTAAAFELDANDAKQAGTLFFVDSNLSDDSQSLAFVAHGGARRGRPPISQVYAASNTLLALKEQLQPPADSPTVEVGPDVVVIGGVRVPKRH